MNKKMLALCLIFVVVFVTIIVVGANSIGNDRQEVAETLRIEQERLAEIQWEKDAPKRAEAERQAEAQVEMVKVERLKIDGSGFCADLQVEQVFVEYIMLQRVGNVFTYNDISLYDGRYDKLEMRIKRTTRKINAILYRLDSVGVFDSETNEEIYEMFLISIKNPITQLEKVFDEMGQVKLSYLGRDIDMFIELVDETYTVYDNLWDDALEIFSIN